MRNTPREQLSRNLVRSGARSWAALTDAVQDMGAVGKASRLRCRAGGRGWPVVRFAGSVAPDRAGAKANERLSVCRIFAVRSYQPLILLGKNWPRCAAYGGYCAWAVSQGYTAKGDPKYWNIVDGRLYLNYDGRVQKDWEKDIPGNISKGDRNWPKVLDK
jgi:hypothetical protein